jgi:hypothetical protein
MRPIGFTDLPTEILFQICRYIDEADRPSLQCLGLVDKALRSVAIPFLFHTFTIKVRGTEELFSDVGLLPSESITSQIRHLIVGGTMKPEIEAERTNRSAYSLDPRGLWQRHEVFPWRLRDMQVDNASWEPLASFIAKLSTLSDLTYNSPEQFAPCILNIIHAQHPTCRLHINTFHLRSLYGPSHELSAYELSLATSPCIYSIACFMEFIDSQEYPDYNKEALMELLAGAAPNLRKLNIFSCGQATVPRRLMRRKPSWQGLKLDSKLEANIGSLEELRIDRPAEEPWLKLTDLSKLCVLEFRRRANVKTFERLLDCNLSSLQKIILHPNYPYTFESEESIDANHDAMVRFLCSLPHLRELSLIYGVYWRMLVPILENIGNQLRTLHLHQKRRSRDCPTGLDTGFSKEQITQINQLCPNLENLSIHVEA